MIAVNRGNPPTLETLSESVDAAYRPLWTQMISHLEEAFHSKPMTAYSSCSAKPGWNLKFKKSGWAVCTLYPEPDGFTALIVLSEIDRLLLEAVGPVLCPYTAELYEKTGFFNGTKWLILHVTDERTLEDAKTLLQIKRDARVKRRDA